MNEAAGKGETLKGLIRALHAGVDPEELKQRFRDEFKGTTPADVARMEEELIAEGLPRKEIQELCGVHLAVLRESLDGEGILAPEGHPIHTLMQEHSLVLQLAEELGDVAAELGEAADPGDAAAKAGRLGEIEEQLRSSQSHYAREENVLFPYLEKHGITQPPAIMWMEHDEIREAKGSLYELIGARERTAPQEFTDRLEEAALSLVDLLSSHFAKEGSVLFPAALEVIGQGEWTEIGRQFDEIGYCTFTPELPRTAWDATQERAAQAEADGVVGFATGSLSAEQLPAILDVLPIDLTFVDNEDRVRYFSKPAARIFERTEAIIGREVQLCHPQKSVHVVNQILDDFRSGSRDVADFWINFGGKFVSIRYFAVRNKKGDYLGCLEVTQDITELRTLEGEKRLL